MNIEKAVKHFSFKLSNVWTATQPDAEAINTIMDYVEREEKRQYSNNELFAKLYIMVYAQFLERYTATIYDDIPQKELTKYLDKPITNIIQRFTDRLNESELYTLFDDLGIKLEHPAEKTTSTIENEINSLKTALNDSKDLKRLNGDVWKYEEVSLNLEMQINKTLNFFTR